MWDHFFTILQPSMWLSWKLLRISLEARWKVGKFRTPFFFGGFSSTAGEEVPQTNTWHWLLIFEIHCNCFPYISVHPQCMQLLKIYPHVYLASNPTQGPTFFSENHNEPQQTLRWFPMLKVLARIVVGSAWVPSVHGFQLPGFYDRPTTRFPKFGL